MIICPQCKTQYSLENKVVTLIKEKFQGGSMDFLLDFRCNDCKHQWQEIISIDDWLTMQVK